MKSAILASSLLSVLLSTHAFADQPNDQGLLGSKHFAIGYKTLSVSAANDDASNGVVLDDHNQIKVIQLLNVRRPSVALSVHIDLARGSSEHHNSSDIAADNDEGSATRDYYANLSYSLSALLRYRPLGEKTLTPYISAGLNSISVDFTSKNRDDTIEELSGYGLIYGAGLEYRWADDLVVSLNYQKITSTENHIESRSIQATIPF